MSSNHWCMEASVEVEGHTWRVLVRALPYDSCLEEPLESPQELHALGELDIWHAYGGPDGIPTPSEEDILAAFMGLPGNLPPWFYDT